MSWKLPPLQRCRYPQHGYAYQARCYQASPMVKAKDERRERRDDFATKPLMMLKLGILKSNF